MMNKFTVLTLAIAGATSIGFANTADKNTASSTRSPTDANTSKATYSTQTGTTATYNSPDHKDKQYGKSHMGGEIRTIDSTTEQQALQSSDLVGADVTDGQQHVVGTISDIELAHDGKAKAVYLDIGGVLGIGSTTYRVPFEQLSVQQDDQGEFSATIEQGALDQLASLSEDLREDMQDWAEEAQDEMADSMEATSEATQKGLAATGNAVTQGAERIGQSTERTGQRIQQGARQADQRMQQGLNTVSAEARTMKRDLRNELSDNSDATQDLPNVDVRVEQDRVILSGIVRSDSTREDIVDAAEELADDREVVDNLIVSATGTASID